MTDRIKELEEQANVILEWCRQQQLPEEERDILELKDRFTLLWERVINPSWNLELGKFRLRKRFKKHTATVYWYRRNDGSVVYFHQPQDTCHTAGHMKFIGTSTVEFTEPQE